MMSESIFHRWRKALCLTQAEAADALGRSRRQAQNYDRGDEDPPRVVLLAMVAISEHPDLAAPDRDPSGMLP